MSKKKNKRRKPVLIQTPAPIDPNALYSPTEAAQQIRVSLRTFETIVKSRKIVPTWVAKNKRMFLGAGLKDYLQRQTGSNAPAA